MGLGSEDEFCSRLLTEHNLSILLFKSLTEKKGSGLGWVEVSVKSHTQQVAQGSTACSIHELVTHGQGRVRIYTVDFFCLRFRFIIWGGVR